MGDSVEYFGAVYDETTNWRALLSDAMHGGLSRGLNIDRHVGLNLHDALGELAEALRGTPMEIGLADAALAVIERGERQEMETVEAAGWQKAPNGFERMLALIEQTPRQLSKRWVFLLYSELLRLKPTDSRLLAAFTKDAHAWGGKDLANLLALVATYNVEWLIEHLPGLRPPVDAVSWRWISRPGTGDAPVRESDPEVVEGNRARLLTAIASLGEPYIQALVDQVKSPPAVQSVVRALMAHPDFAGRI